MKILKTKKNNKKINKITQKDNKISKECSNKKNKKEYHQNKSIYLYHKRKNNQSYIPIESYFKPKKEQSLYLLNKSINI